MLLFKARPRKDPALSAQLTPSERRMMATLRDTRAEIQGKFRARRADIMRALLHSPITQIVRLIPTDPWYDAQAMLQAELQAELLDAGRRVKLPPIQKATIAYRFDADRPEAAGWAAKEAGSLIQDITNDQVTFVRDIVSRSQFGEFTPAQAARVFRQIEDGLGLTVQQSEWVENFRQRRITEAMSRGRSYEQAESEAAKPTARYADRVYRYRTETIARTEIMRASNEGRNQAWAQGIEGGWIAPDSLKKWSVERDGRECSICRPLGDLEPIPINASFPQGDPPVHPNCRCTVVLTDEIPADLAQMTDDELEAEINRLLNDKVPTDTTTAPGPQPQGYHDYSDNPEAGTSKWNAPTDLTRTQRAQIDDAVREYQGTLASGLNSHLREKSQLYPEEVAAKKALDLLIRKSDGLNEDVTLWRGFVWDEDRFRTGETISTAGYTSTSFSRRVAEKHVGKRKGWLMKVDAPKGTPGFAMNALRPDAVRADEYEYVLPRDIKMRVVSVDVENRIVHVEVKSKTTRKAAVEMPLLPRPNDERFVGYASDFIVVTA